MGKIWSKTFGKSLKKQMVQKFLVNLPVGLTVHIDIGKEIWQIEHCSPYLPKFSHFKYFYVQ